MPRGQHPNSRKNLKEFKPGPDTRRNLKGGPRKLPNLDVLMADMLGEEDEDGKTKAAHILDAMYKQALKGDKGAADLLLDRGFGKVKQTIENTGAQTVTQIVVNRKIVKRGE